MNKNKEFVYIVISGFITGLISQYNWLSETLLIKGLIKTTTANFPRLITGGFSRSNSISYYLFLCNISIR